MRLIRLPVFVSSLIVALGLSAGCGVSTDDGSELLSGSATSCPANIAWQSPTLPAGNAGLRNFANANLGRQVGSGECSDLADKGLLSIGYKTYNNLGPTGLDANYVWGTAVRTITTSARSAAGVIPGDVIQYRNFSQRVTNADGSWWTSNAAHHTSVVKGVSADGKHLCVFEQNVGGRRTVGTGYVNLDAMNGGTLWVFRPTR